MDTEIPLPAISREVSEIFISGTCGTTECTYNYSVLFFSQIANAQLTYELLSVIIICGCLIDYSLTKHFANELH